MLRAADGFDLTNSTRLTVTDATTAVSRAWKDAITNAGPWHGTEKWIPSIEQTGRAEQVMRRGPSPRNGLSRLSRPSLLPPQEAWLRVYDAAATESAGTATMVGAWLNMSWRTDMDTPNRKGVTAIMAVASHGHTDVRAGTSNPAYISSQSLPTYAHSQPPFPAICLRSS